MLVHVLRIKLQSDIGRSVILHQPILRCMLMLIFYLESCDIHVIGYDNVLVNSIHVTFLLPLSLA